jgi:hypothetical protein
MGMLDLTMDERRLVTRLLDQAFQDLREEIYKTDTLDMKKTLEEEKRVLASVLAKLGIEKPDTLLAHRAK